MLVYVLKIMFICTRRHKKLANETYNFQLRLRNLIQIIGCNLKTETNNEICWFYYTLHRTSMSSPIYTSEAIDNVNPRWSSLEVPIIYATSYSTANGEFHICCDE